MSSAIIGYLPRRPESIFMPEALEQLAAGVVGKPLYGPRSTAAEIAAAGLPRPREDAIGKVTRTEVVGARVKFWATVEPDELDGVPLKCGADLSGKRRPDGVWESVDRVGGVIVSPETDAEMLERLGTDGQAWATEFVGRFHGRIVRSHSEQSGDVDEGLMIGWFANAIEAGRAASTPAPAPDYDLER